LVAVLAVYTEIQLVELVVVVVLAVAVVYANLLHLVVADLVLAVKVVMVAEATQQTLQVVVAEQVG